MTLNVSGDLLWHSPLWEVAEMDAQDTGNGEMDFLPQLEDIQEYISAADVAVCQAEVPFAPEGGPYTSYPDFSAPPRIADTIAELGFDVCTTASNHTLDVGFEGLVRTLDTLEAAGVEATGAYRTQEEAERPFIHTTDQGVKLAIVSQTYGLNGKVPPPGKDWSVDLLDAPKAIADAKAAREAGADIVAVHMHAGTEYQTMPDRQQQRFAEQVTASGEVDVIFGQHAHWVQPVDIVNGVWVVYGTGNLMALQESGRPGTYDGAIVELTFTEQPEGGFTVTDAEFAPTMIQGLSMDRTQRARLHLIPDAWDDHPELAERFAASAQRTRQAIRALGVEGLRERE